MTALPSPPFQRAYAATLTRRLAEPRRFLQIVAGARQVGKTTLVEQVLTGSGLPNVFASADEPALRDAAWLAAQWERGRLAAAGDSRLGAVLALDEVQKIPGWSETVKHLWDGDTRARKPLKVVLLGSAPLLVQQGLSESLAGRFEVLHLPHWSLVEMQAAFGFNLEQYLYFGGYPGAAPLVADPQRWRRYVLDALIEPTIARDVLLITRVDKPALLRRLFELGCRYSGQVLSYTKMLGQLHDAGNTTTLAHYLELLAGAGMVAGLPKYAGQALRQRGSSPKLQVMNTALMTALSGRSFAEARADREFWGRLTESSVGAHLVNAAARGVCEVFYWRERNREVDFAVRAGRRLVAIEVKSGRSPDALPGLGVFAEAFKPSRTLLVGNDGIPVAEFLDQPVEHWLQG
ncbi:MAG: ATP-binding protein [Candidatus Latescibacteria bacterium]|nr:ATP-binding protein [Candidatus Latescibacterota bacterium]